MTIPVRLRWRNEDKGCGDAFWRGWYLKGREVVCLVLQSSDLVIDTPREGLRVVWRDSFLHPAYEGFLRGWMVSRLLYL